MLYEIARGQFPITMQYKYLLVALVIWTRRVFGDDEWVVQTVHGLVRGWRDEAGYYSFRGIPYAEPPVGKYRYKNPRAPLAWEGILNANKDNIQCPQVFREEYVGNEDCLILNVYTPADSNLLPVMVFVHGGAYSGGSSSGYGPQHLIPHGVILVTINYRTGLTGFLCLGHELAPGNAGQKDQIAALRWVQQNIAAFGGDPDNVTVFGQSSGAASTDLLTLSPMSNGLFKRAITQSGSAVTAWAVNTDPVGYAKSIAEIAGYNGGDDIQNLVEFYFNHSMEDLIKASEIFGDSLLDTTRPFAPCLETENFGQERFIYEMPLDIIRAGNYNSIPMMTGATTRDGDIYGTTEDEVSQFPTQLANHLPADLRFESNEQRLQVAEKVKHFYLNDSVDLAILENQYFNYRTDVFFYYGGVRTVQERVRTSTEPIYFYEYRYTEDPESPGAKHGAELRYLIRDNSNSFSDLMDQAMSSRLTALWTNFAKFGNPTSELTDVLPITWEPVKENQFNYFILDRELKLDQSPKTAAIQLWNDIYAEFY